MLKKNCDFVLSFHIFTLSEENFNEIFKRTDTNADGELDYAEFISMIIKLDF